jgi:hypothetical protein
MVAANRKTSNGSRDLAAPAGQFDAAVDHQLSQVVGDRQSGQAGEDAADGAVEVEQQVAAAVHDVGEGGAVGHPVNSRLMVSQTVVNH